MTEPYRAGENPTPGAQSKPIGDFGPLAFLRWVGFEPPVVPVRGWLNTGPLLDCGVFSSDNSLTLILMAHVPITADHALGMGLKVSTQVPGEIHDLMHLYKLGITTKRPGVEFVPLRWRPPGRQMT